VSPMDSFGAQIHPCHSRSGPNPTPNTKFMRKIYRLSTHFIRPEPLVLTRSSTVRSAACNLRPPPPSKPQPDAVAASDGAKPVLSAMHLNNRGD